MSVRYRHIFSNFKQTHEIKTRSFFFIAGDTFEKLEDEDEQGWCKGRKDGRVGLYPANYIEVIE